MGKPGGVRRFKVARAAVGRMRTVMMAFAVLMGFVLASASLLRSALHLPPLVTLGGVVVSVAALLVYMNLPGWVELGAEGLHADLRGEKHYVPFSDVDEVQLFQKNAGGKRFVGVKLVRSAQPPLEIPFGEDQFGTGDRAKLLCDAIAEALAGYRRGNEDEGAPALARGAATSAAWIARLRGLGEAANAGPREAPVPRDRLLRIVEDAHAEPAARASAAVALGPRLDADVRRRIAAAAASTASPKLRVALEASAGDDDAVLANALDEVERERSS